MRTAFSETLRASGPALPFGKDVEVFYDGDCPLCLREIALLRRLDRLHRIQFTNIADPDFDPAVTGRSFDELMREIHGRIPDGTVIHGVEVFRRLYSAVGFGWLVSLSRLPGVSQLLGAGYRLFARNRLWITGRCRDTSCSIKSGG